MQLCSERLVAVKITVSSASACTGARTADERRRWLVRDLNDFDNVVLLSGGVWDAHVVEAVVVFYVLVIEPRTAACLPGRCAHHTKLGCASTTLLSVTVPRDLKIMLTRSCGCSLPSAQLQPCSCSTSASPALSPSALGDSSPRPLDTRVLCGIAHCTTRTPWSNKFRNVHTSARMSSPSESSLA